VKTIGPLGKRPSPEKISFARSCFVADGEREVYVVAAPNGSTSYPKRFDDQPSADAYARRTGLVVHVVKEPIWKRVSWTEVAGG
jgi:hypothetical protein